MLTITGTPKKYKLLPGEVGLVYTGKDVIRQYTTVCTIVTGAEFVVGTPEEIAAFVVGLTA